MSSLLTQGSSAPSGGEYTFQRLRPARVPAPLAPRATYMSDHSSEGRALEAQVRTFGLADEELNVVVVRGKALRARGGDVCVAAHQAAKLRLERRAELVRNVAEALRLVHLRGRTQVCRAAAAAAARPREAGAALKVVRLTAVLPLLARALGVYRLEQMKLVAQARASRPFAGVQRA